MSDKKKTPYDRSEPRIVTMASLRNPERDDDDEQAYYAGGSEHSGQQVLGPGKRKHDDNRRKGDTASSLASAFRDAAELQHHGQPSGSRPRKFTGKGHRLGDGTANEEDESQGAQNGPDEEALRAQMMDMIDLTGEESEGSSDSDNHPHEASFVGSDSEDSGEREVKIVLYADGFTIEDEPLRSYDDPACHNLEELIKLGQFPASLIPERFRRSSLAMCVIDRRPRKYSPPSVPMKPFGGKGHVLGSPAPELGANQVAVQAVSSEEPSPKKEEEKKDFDFSNEESEATVLKVRLPTGETLSIKMNLSSTVLQLRENIVLARPQLGAQTFSILSAFPRRVFENMTETLLNCGLKNACITLMLNESVD